MPFPPIEPNMPFVRVVVPLTTIVSPVAIERELVLFIVKLLTVREVETFQVVLLPVTAIVPLL